MQRYEMVRKTIVMDDNLAKDIDLFARKEARDFSGALRYAARIGLLAVENPELTIQEIKDILDVYYSICTQMVDFYNGFVLEFHLCLPGRQTRCTSCSPATLRQKP